MSTDARTAKDIFVELVSNVPPEEWENWLEQSCPGNDELRNHVRVLLRAHAEPGSFLERPAVAAGATILHELPISEQAGTIVGPYKLLQQIGEGGMGVVFMAEQTAPIQRTVALKIIKPGMDTRQVIARFEAERQALAMMDHPSIAKVLDADTTGTGRPYFVMELVKGVPIIKYCDDNRLTVSHRLALFMQVCHAVQHAHQKGIIHRDLKPTNVLVAEYDGQPVPKIIDFGVAKATAQKLTERTMFTEFGQVIGTVEYMSPEQARFNQLDIDTRSDVYSLGVLLYELLTGSTPFERKRLREAAFDEVLRIIREEEPPKPSTRLSTSDTLPSIAASRHTEPARLNKDVRGELDWIVMKCLEKDRNRRYETASAFAADVERYLNDEAVAACPPSAAYRLKKFARRNRGMLTASAAVVAALLIGTVASTWQAIRATRAEALAQERLAAETQARQRAEAVARVFLSMTGSDGIITAAETSSAAVAFQRLSANELQEGRYANAFRAARLGTIDDLDSLIASGIASNAPPPRDPIDALVIGELRLVAGQTDAASAVIRDAIARGQNEPSAYKTLGWALLCQQQPNEANEAFRQALETLRQNDGTLHLAKADPDQLTAAYFLDLVSEQEYIARLKDDKRLAYAWFYIAQRHEIEGNREAAITAYKRCAELGHPNVSAQAALSRWRLKKLGQADFIHTPPQTSAVGTKPSNK